MFLTGRLAPYFGLEKIFQMMAWRVMAHAVADSFWGSSVLASSDSQNCALVNLKLRTLLMRKMRKINQY
jgi:hypothetical protein